MSTDGVGFKLIESSNHMSNPPNSLDEVALRLKLIRGIYGISQRELAKRAGVTNSSISMIELGQVSPSVQSLERILSAIPISLSNFFSFQSVSSVRIARISQESEKQSSITNDIFFKASDQLFSRTIAIPRGITSDLSVMAYDVCGVVVAGQVELKSIGVTESLVIGSMFYIPAHQLHQFNNPGEVTANLFICSLSAHSF